ncbi:hypothetical protein BaRGS_00031515, partial [Batillaria attramentaria]
MHSKGLKRAADVLVADEALLAALTEACPDFDVGADAPLSVVVEDAFRQVDANNDGELQGDEVARFNNLI